MAAWGFPVQLIAEASTLAQFDAALPACDVVYLPMDVASSAGPLLAPASKGIVCEEGSLYSDLGISQSSSWEWTTSINILDNTHEITKPFALGGLQIFSSTDDVSVTWQQIAPGANILAKKSGYNVMVTLDPDGALFGGGTAPARRVALPWGDQNFDFNNVNSDGLILMRRAIAWAAAPVGVSSVQITLQIGSEPSGRVETLVQLLNVPEIQ